LSTALENLNRGLQINPHDEYTLNLKTLIEEGLKEGYLKEGGQVK